MPKYDIDVQLTGTDGNAFFMIGKVRNALRDAGVSKEEIQEFSDEAMSGNYDHVLQTIMTYVNVL